jgi:hypothetical protein
LSTYFETAAADTSVALANDYADENGFLSPCRHFGIGMIDQRSSGPRIIIYVFALAAKELALMFYAS